MRNVERWIAACLLVCMLVSGCSRQATVDLEPTTQSPIDALTPTPLSGYTRASSGGSVATSTATPVGAGNTPSPLLPTATPLPDSTQTTPAASPTPTPGPGTPTALPPSPAPTFTGTAVPTETPTSAPPTATPLPDDSTEWEAEGRIAQDEYEHEIEAGEVTFHWRTDGTYLYCALSGFTTGWLAVGFEPEEQMRGANFLFGYVHGGKAYVADMYGAQPFGSGSHPPDTDLGGSDDIIEYGGRESDGLTVIEFVIPLDSGDPYDKALSVGETYDVILATGDQDSFDSYHFNRAWGEMILD